MLLNYYVCTLFTLIFLAFSNASKETLVLLNNLVIKETHSILFKTLKDRGYQLTFKSADDPSLVLSKYGKYFYENLIIFAPNVQEFGGSLGVDTITEFIDNGGNVLFTGGASTGSALRELAAECGFEVTEENSLLIDHLNYDASDPGKHTRVVVSSSNLIKSEEIVGKPNNKDLLYEGTTIIADPQNLLVLPILHAEDTAYSYKPDVAVKDYSLGTGKDLLLIAALQARNNARVVFSGSLYFFSDSAFKSSIQRITDGKTHDISGNQEAAINIALWTLKDRGVIRVKSVSHHKLGETSPPPSYTIMDMAVYLLELERWENGNWIPHNANDVQVEFVRIDPFWRGNLKNIGSGKYEFTFKIPDTYGVYQFKVDYNRIGFTSLRSSTMVSVIPLEHTQYERFILSAYPYYASAFSMMFGVFVFSFVFLHYRDDSDKVKGE
ncbi:dolichyl-diphosphooligosaccharide--protein glycosyltransferase 48 kDa subunit-like [Daktulosphaira vitifoliae]|uniref:dolichyl-diphosphooligosaccharide--protein glycosyltransferase 48 kDa subunit-like n=2 Tax=Daktulosphaira vitifoliae TaxID=58002 RepID=UPI0021A9ECD4|nr:dolichyl-diphosphooligosaccharide--protein glycosyltransferase 48 kDa subunit-like [Daktulosphaira vitifoliae]XP_050546813.1 dolichyl-diphosphooligosaccharide--protein glycosyltransferase 48 kDa subunit-like [Daktulosphaira vitifoliae]